jgi:hypothetical protein
MQTAGVYQGREFRRRGGGIKAEIALGKSAAAGRPLFSGTLGGDGRVAESWPRGRQNWQNRFNSTGPTSPDDTTSSSGPATQYI